jgi:hypothetical protein
MNQNSLANQQHMLWFAVPFTTLNKLRYAKMLGQNHFAKPNW